MKKVFLLFMFLLLSISLIGMVEQLSLTEQIQKAKLIFKGQSIDKECYWNPQNTAIITRYTFQIEKVLFGNYENKEIQLEFFGGEIDGKGVHASDVPEINLNEESVYLITDPAVRHLSPITGVYQGLYVEAIDSETGQSVVKTGDGKTFKTDFGTTPNLQDFTQMLITMIPTAKSLPLPDKSIPPELQKYVITDLTELPYDDSSKPKGGVVNLQGNPVEINKPTPLTEESSLIQGSASTASEPKYVLYSFKWQGNDYDAFNTLPAGGTLSGHDLSMMARWNQYVDLFMRYQTSSGTWAANNDISDQCGFVSNALMEEHFDFSWGSYLAVCVSYHDGNEMTETDIAFNPVYYWTSNDSAAYYQSNLHSIDQAMLHELGHATGFDHDFYAQSIMAYAPHVFRSYPFIYHDDVSGLRAMYPSRMQNFTDGYITGFYVNTAYENAWGHSTYSCANDSLLQGQHFDINNLTLANSGTSNITVQADFYLVSSVYDYSDAIPLGSQSYVDISGTYAISATSLTVPRFTPPGRYKVMIVTNTANDGCFYNDITWVGKTLKVGTAPADGIWIGSTSNNWHTAANWSNEIIPTSTMDVVIPDSCTYYPYITDADAFCKNIMIEKDAQLAMYNNCVLTVNGNYTTSGNLYMLPAAPKIYISGFMHWKQYSNMSESSYDYEIHVQGDWIMDYNATATFNTGTQIFEGSSNASFITSSPNSYLTNVVISKTSGHGMFYPASSHADLRITNLTLNAGTFFQQTSMYSLVMGGNLTTHATANFSQYAGELKLNGYTQVINFGNNGCFVNNLYMNSASIVTLNCPLNIYGDIFLFTGTLIPNGYTIYLKGSWLQGPGASFEKGVGRVVLNGYLDQYIESTWFHTLEINKNGGIVNILENQFVNVDSYDYTNGTLVLNGGFFIAHDMADFNLIGNYIVNTGHLNLTMNSTTSFNFNGNMTINGGEVNLQGGSGFCWWPYSTASSLTMTGGVLEFNNTTWAVHNTPAAFTANITGGTIRTTASIEIERSDFCPMGGTIEMYGSPDANISCASGSQVYSLRIIKYDTRARSNSLRHNTSQRSASVTATSNLTVGGDFNLYTGTFTAPAIMVVKGNWYNQASQDAFIEGTNTVNFQGNSSSRIQSYETFYNLTVNKVYDQFNALEIMDNYHVSVLGNLSLIDGCLEMDNSTVLDVTGNIIISEGAGLNGNLDTNLRISLKGNFTDYNPSAFLNYGFYEDNLLFEVVGNTDQFFSNPNSDLKFSNLTVTKPSGTIRMNTGFEARNLTLNSGSWAAEGTDYKNNITGDLYIAAGFHWYDHANSITFDGTDNQNINIIPDATDVWFSNISINKPGTINGTVHLLNNLNLKNSATLSINNATLDCGSHIVNTNGYININAQGILDVGLGGTVKVGQALTVNSGGLLNLNGYTGYNAGVTHSETGYYELSVEPGGMISASCASFEYMNLNGVNVKQGALVDTVNTFNNCTFWNGQTGGTLLTLDSEQNLTINNISFLDNPSTSTYNISKTVNSGHVLISSCNGHFATPDFENDIWKLIDWTGFLPNITISEIYASNTSPNSGETITLYVTVNNQTGVDINSGFDVELYYDLDYNPNQGETGNVTYHIDSLPSFSSVTCIFPNIVHSGDYSWNVRAQADLNAVITEREELDNNFGPYALNWGGIPSITGLTISLNEAGSIVLNWTYPGEFTHFNIYTDPDPNGLFTTLLGTATTTSFEDVDLPSKKFYRVTAVRESAKAIQKK